MMIGKFGGLFQFTAGLAEKLLRLFSVTT